MPWVENFLEWLNQFPTWIGILILGLGALIEYVFPPFPGDTVVVAGAVLVGAAGWPWWGVWGSVIAGSIIGSMFNYWIGQWLVNRPDGHWARRLVESEKVAPKLAKIKRHLARRSTYYLLMNRFIPAFRALIFLASGMSGVDARKVALLAGISAALWNAMLVGAGMVLGYHLDELVGFVTQYTRWVLIILGAILVLFVLKSTLLKRSSASEEIDPK